MISTIPAAVIGCWTSEARYSGAKRERHWIDEEEKATPQVDFS